jgi:hypothetical protein
MDAGIVGSGNIGATAGPCLEFSAYLSRVGRADERTRTADLLITSLLAGVLTRTGASGNCAYLCGFR